MTTTKFPHSLRSLLLLAASIITLALPLAEAATPIEIGRSLVLSGPLTPYGEAKRDGGDAYIEKINKAGGINGRRIVLTTLDDAYDPAKTVANLKKIAGEKRPSAFLGLFGVPTVAAALPVLEELRIPAVGLTSGSPALRAPLKKYVFPVRASYVDEADYIVGHIKTLGYKRVSIIRQENPFGELVRNTLAEALNKEGIKIVGEAKLAATATDASEAVAAAVASKPDAIFLAMLSNGAVPTIESAKARGILTPSLYAFSPVDASLLVGKLDKVASGLAITQIVPLPSSTHTRVATEYTEALKELGRGTPSFYGLEAFIEAKILVAALQRAGRDAGDPEAIVRALEAMGDYDAGGFSVNYSKGLHRGAKFVELTMIGSRGTVVR
jgi:branched-chain amino acid transport system substrate-binding protein